MGATVNIVAVVIAIAGVLAALANTAYLALLNNAAAKRAGGAPVGQYVRSRWPIALGTTATALLAWVLTGADSIPVDVIALGIGAGSGAVAVRALQSTQARYRSGG